MTYHIVVLYTLASYIAHNHEDKLNKSKRLLIHYFEKDNSFHYLDEPLLEEDIKHIGTFFEEPVAVC